MVRGEMVEKGLYKAVIAADLNKDLFVHYKR